MIIRARIHTPTACQTTFVIKSRRLIYALAVNRRGSVRPSVAPSYIHHSFPAIAANFPNFGPARQGPGSSFIRAFRPKIARSPQVRNDYSAASRENAIIIRVVAIVAAGCARPLYYK